jgi:hypothetical protein
MAADGLVSGMSRPIRRNTFHQMGNMNSAMQAPMQPSMPRYTPVAGGSNDVIHVNKLE